MDPIISEYLTTLVTRMQALSSGPYTAATEQQLTSLISSTISEYATKYGTTNPESVIAIRALNSPEMVAKYTQGATFISEATKSGIPAETARAIVRDALVNGTPIGQTSAPVAPELDQAIQQARQATREFLNTASKSQVPSQITSGSSKAVESFVSARRYLPQGTVDVANTVAAAESAAPAVAQDVAKILVPKVEESSSSLYKFVSSIIPGLAGLTRNRSVLIGGAGLGLAAIGATASGLLGSTPTPPKSSPEIPIGPSAMQNLPSAASPGPSADDLEYQRLLNQVNSMPENAGKYQAMGSLIVRRLTALESRRKELQTKLDSLDPTNLMQKDAYASIALLLRDTLTSIDKENDNWAKNEGLKRDQAKFDAANSPENLDLEKRAKEAAIASANASAAASQSSAANSAMQRAVNEFQLAQAKDLAPTVKARAEADLAAVQANLQIAEATLHKLQAEALQKDTVDSLTQQYNNGELTYEQYAEQALTASGKVEELIRFRTDMLKDKHAQEQAAIQQGNWEKSFGLQQQAAALAQSEAEANAAFRKSQEERAKQAQLMQGAAKVEELRAQQKRDYQNAWNATTFLSESNLNNLKSFHTPMAAEQVATISGMDANSPEFQKIYGIYSQMLASGPQTPAQPGGPQSTPSPAPPRPAPSTITPQAPSFSQALAGMTPAPSPAPTPAPLVPMNMGPFTNALAAR